MGIDQNKKEIVLNKVKVEIEKFSGQVSFFEENQLNDEKYIYCRYKPTKLLQKFKSVSLGDEIENWISSLKKLNIKEEKYIYLSFFKSNKNNYAAQLKYEKLPNELKKKFLKEVIIEKLKSNYIVEPFREGVDLSVYKQKEQSERKNNFNQYERYDILINVWKDNIELKIGIGSTDTYIGKLNNELENSISKFNNLKFVNINLLIKLVDSDFNLDVKANYEIRKKLNIKPRPIKKFYRDYYILILNFIKELSDLLKDTIVVHQNLIQKNTN